MIRKSSMRCCSEGEVVDLLYVFTNGRLHDLFYIVIIITRGSLIFVDFVPMGASFPRLEESSKQKLVRRMIVTDELNAIKAAVEDGIVPGNVLFRVNGRFMLNF
jgi:hypothetical protein